MTVHQILRVNAAATAGCSLVMLVTRGWLYTLFSFQTPVVLDIVAVVFLAYAAVLVAAARREHVGATPLMVFTAVDGAWVVFSVVALALFWTEWSVLARFLTIAVALVVELFAALQFRAATVARRRVAAV